MKQIASQKVDTPEQQAQRLNQWLEKDRSLNCFMILQVDE